MKNIIIALLLSCLLALAPSSSQAQLVLPGAGGGTATTPCTSTASSLQYDNAGAFGCIAGATSNGTGIQVTANGALSSSTGPALSANGTWITGGSATTNKPYWLIEPSGTTSTGWNTSGTGLGINAASGYSGYAIDVQNNGTTKWNLDSFGDVLTNGYHRVNSVYNLGGAGSSTSLVNAGTIIMGWAPSTNVQVSPDTAFTRNAAGIVEIDNGSACSTASNCRDLILRHQGASGAAPTANSCSGFSLATGGGDLGGHLTYTSATTCSITFGTAFTNTPTCSVWGNVAAPVLPSAVTVSTTGIAATFGSAQTSMAWHCDGL